MLSAHHREWLLESLSGSLNPSPNVGHTIEMGDKFIDYSAATQLKKLTALLGIGV